MRESQHSLYHQEGEEEEEEGQGKWEDEVEEVTDEWVKVNVNVDIGQYTQDEV